MQWFGATTAAHVVCHRRGFYRFFAQPLSAEDCALPSMPDASPVKWHLTHTTWFFETFVLERALPGYRLFSPQFRVPFNCYYVAVGPRFEADAYARWADVRLPTAAEWETFATPQPVRGNFLEDGQFHPQPGGDQVGPLQVYGDVWEWTRSSYEPYPGYRAAPGAVGEYNGKFMSNQYVLRDAGFAHPRDLPQFLSRRGALAVQRRASRTRFSLGSKAGFYGLRAHKVRIADVNSRRFAIDV